MTVLFLSPVRRALARLRHFIGVGHYVSTACYHGEHESCRRRCKFCQDECACKCHGRQLPFISWGRTYP